MAVRSEELDNGERRAARRDPHTRYLFGGYIGAEVAGFIIWLAVWLLDGLFTVQFIHLFGGSTQIGIGAHLVITLVQRFAYLGGRFGVYFLTFLVGLINVFSSTWGLQAFFTARGAPSGAASWVAALMYTGLAVFIAIGPERLGVGHVFALWRLLKGR